MKMVLPTHYQIYLKLSIIGYARLLKERKQARNMVICNICPPNGKTYSRRDILLQQQALTDRNSSSAYTIVIHFLLYCE